MRSYEKIIYWEDEKIQAKTTGRKTQINFKHISQIHRTPKWKACCELTSGTWANMKIGSKSMY